MFSPFRRYSCVFSQSIIHSKSERGITFARTSGVVRTLSATSGIRRRVNPFRSASRINFPSVASRSCTVSTAYPDRRTPSSVLSYFSAENLESRIPGETNLESIRKNVSVFRIVFGENCSLSARSRQSPIAVKKVVLFSSIKNLLLV